MKNYSVQPLMTNQGYFLCSDKVLDSRLYKRYLTSSITLNDCMGKSDCKQFVKISVKVRFVTFWVMKPTPDSGQVTVRNMRLLSRKVITAHRKGKWNSNSSYISRSLAWESPI